MEQYYQTIMVLWCVLKELELNTYKQTVYFIGKNWDSGPQVRAPDPPEAGEEGWRGREGEGGLMASRQQPTTDC